MPATPPPSTVPPRRLKAESPEDLLAVLPYLMGYQPDESLVMAVLGDRVIEVCVRVDLDEPVDEVADRFHDIAETNGSGGVLLLAYSADPDRADRMLLPMIDHLEGFGIIEALYTDGSRWWSRVCDDDCCPPEGIAYDVDNNRLAAEAVFHGMTRQSGRDALERAVQGPPPEALEALTEVTEEILTGVFEQTRDQRCRQIRCWILDYVERRLREDTVAVDDRELITLACLVIDIPVRDTAWALIRREDAWVHVELWQQVLTRAVTALQVPTLGLLGMAGWISGQGTLQVCCIERARELDPDYSLIDILDDINRRALPPSFWESIRPSMQDALEEDLTGPQDGGDALGQLD